MLNIGWLKFLTHSVMGVALLTSLNIAVPSASLAQRPLATPQKKQRVAPPVQPVQSNTVLDTNYTLGGGDRIRVNVFEVPEYTGEYQVPPGGAINLPLIGSVSVLGLTTEQAADEISKRYSRFLKRPLISINLLASRPINIFVAGEVTRPGAYTLSLEGGAGNQPGVQYPTLLAGLTIAQGVTLAADVTQVQLRRKIGRSSEQTVTLNLKELIQTGRISQDITLRDGDTIVVPTATTFNLTDARNISSANFAADNTKARTVSIIGEVRRPGSYLVSAGSTAGQNGANVVSVANITTAIQLAGGITPQADVRSLKIRRPTRSGTEQTIDINLWQLLQNGDVNQDIIVQDGDTIIVPTATEINVAEATQLATSTFSPTKIVVGVVGEVKKPGPVDLVPNSSLNQALLAAGGFNDARAKSGAVDLIRLNPNGSVTKRVVKVDFAQGINEQTNPILRDNDVVVVNRNGITQTSDTLTTIASPFGIIFNVLRLFGIGF